MGRITVKSGAVCLISVLALLALAACGGGAASTNATATNGAVSGTTPSAADATFVDGLCGAGRTFSDSLTAVLKEPGVLNDTNALVAKLQGPYTTFAQEFRKVKAPPDLVQWQSDTAQALDDAAAKVKAGAGLNQILSSGSQLVPSVPKSASARLSGLVAANADCTAAGLSFGTRQG